MFQLCNSEIIDAGGWKNHSRQQWIAKEPQTWPRVSVGQLLLLQRLMLPGECLPQMLLSDFAAPPQTTSELDTYSTRTTGSKAQYLNHFSATTAGCKRWYNFLHTQLDINQNEPSTQSDLLPSTWSVRTTNGNGPITVTLEEICTCLIFTLWQYRKQCKMRCTCTDWSVNHLDYLARKWIFLQIAWSHRFLTPCVQVRPNVVLKLLYIDIAAIKLWVQYSTGPL